MAEHIPSGWNPRRLRQNVGICTLAAVLAPFGWLVSFALARPRSPWPHPWDALAEHLFGAPGLVLLCATLLFALAGRFFLRLARRFVGYVEAGPDGRSSADAAAGLALRWLSLGLTAPCLLFAWSHRGSSELVLSTILFALAVVVAQLGVWYGRKLDAAHAAIAAGHRAVRRPGVAPPPAPAGEGRALWRAGLVSGGVLGVVVSAPAVLLATAGIAVLSRPITWKRLDGLIVGLSMPLAAAFCLAIGALFARFLRRLGPLSAALRKRADGLVAAARGAPDYTLARPEVERVAGIGRLLGIVARSFQRLALFAFAVALVLDWSLRPLILVLPVALTVILDAAATALEQVACGLLELARVQDATLPRLELAQSNPEEPA